MPNIFALGSGAFGQTQYTWDVFNIITTTTYTANKCAVLIAGGSYYVYYGRSLTDVFGFDTFYYGTGVSNYSLVDAQEATNISTIGDLYTLGQGVYIQPADDYLNDSKEHIFTVDSGSLNQFGVDIYSMTPYGTMDVPVLASATEGTTATVTSAHVAGWNSTDHYYYGEKTSTTTQSKGSSTGNTETSYNANAYPVDGIQGGYWYVRR